MDNVRNATPLSVSARLRTALERGRVSIKALQEGVAGTQSRLNGPAPTYATVHRYVTGKSPAPLEFLAAAATVLDVRFAWLTAGHGEMTEGMERERLRQDFSIGLVNRQEVERGLRQGFPIYDELPRPVTNCLLRAWLTQTGRTFVDAAAVRGSLDKEAAEKRAYAIGRFVSSAFHLCAVDPARMAPGSLSLVVMQLAEALAAIAPESRLNSETSAAHLRGSRELWSRVIANAAGFVE
jgi:hypothetical protein